MSNESRTVKPDLRPLYPPCEPTNRFRLKVDELHELEVEEAETLTVSQWCFFMAAQGAGSNRFTASSSIPNGVSSLFAARFRSEYASCMFGEQYDLAPCRGYRNDS